MMISSTRFKNSGRKCCAQRIHDQARPGFARFFLGDVLRADVRSHDDDGVLEIDRSPLPVRDPSIIEHLEQAR